MAHCIVADTNGTTLAFLKKLLQRAPRLAAQFFHRPVDKIQIDEVEPQSVQARIARRQCLFETLISVPELGSHEQFAARDTALAQCITNGTFVTVYTSRVYVPVSCLKCVQHRVVCLLTGLGLENTKTQCRNLDTIVEYEA